MWFGSLGHEDRRLLAQRLGDMGQGGLCAAFGRASIDGFLNAIEHLADEARFGAAGVQVVADHPDPRMGLDDGRTHSWGASSVSPSASSISPNSTCPIASVARLGSPLQNTSTFWWVRPSLRDASNWRPARIGSDPLRRRARAQRGLRSVGGDLFSAEFDAHVSPTKL